jgi:autotransporter translocation and assembly factor TamB
VLLFDKPASELGGRESAGLQQQAIGLAGSYVAPDLRSSVLGTLGLDAFDVSLPQATQATVKTPGRVSIGRYVSSDVFVSLAQEFGTRVAQVVGMEYRLRRNLSLKPTFRSSPRAILVNYLGRKPKGERGLDHS